MLRSRCFLFIVIERSDLQESRGETLKIKIIEIKNGILKIPKKYIKLLYVFSIDFSKVLKIIDLFLTGLWLIYFRSDHPEIDVIKTSMYRLIDRVIP